MTLHLFRDLEALKRELLIMGSLVEDATNKAILSLLDRRPDLAEEVRAGDFRIDTKENQIEEECLKILALHQPVAADLRFIIAALKVNNDLERMGDLAVNIAERAAHLAILPQLAVSLDFEGMLTAVQRMVHQGLQSLITSDTELARRVLAMDDEVDAWNRKMFVVLQDVMRQSSDTIDRAVNLLSVSRHLERMADISTNIAEDVVFMVEGEVLRHNFQEFPKKNKNP